MSSSPNKLWLENQICFPLYAVSRLVTKLYAPFLDKMELTYPQYLVMLVLWKEDGKTVSDLTDTLLLETNTMTPLLKRMEQKGYITRSKSKDDERKVIVKLTESGKALQELAMCIPDAIIQRFNHSEADEREAEAFSNFKFVLNKMLVELQSEKI